MRLAEALEQTATATLRRVASSHGLPQDESTTRGELIERILERFSDAAYVEQQLRGLSADQRDVVLSARASAGELRGLLVDSEHPGAAEDLADRGWLYRVFAAAGPLRGEVFVVPDELLAVLPPLESDVVQVGRLAADPNSPAEPRWTDPAFSLFALASALSRPGSHLEADVRPWSEEPGGWAWDARWTFLQHVALGAGLLVSTGSGRYGVANGLPRLLDDPPALADRLRRGYLRDTGWSELAHSGVELASGDSDLVDTLALRRAVFDVVAQLPPGGWLDLDGLMKWLQRTRPLLVREQLNPRGLIRLQSLSFAELEQPLLRYFLLGPLYWLGVLAAARDGASISRRVAPGADRSASEAVGQAGSSSPVDAVVASRGEGTAGSHASGQRRGGAAAEPCRWEGAADLLAPASAQLGTLLQAERYLVLRERGRVSRYHLVQAHVAAALGGGGSIAECRQLLVRLTQAPLPSAIDERLKAWDQRFGAFEVRPAVLLEARSATELDEAIAEEKVRGFVRRRIGEIVAEVAAADALELAAALRGAGHLPRIDAALRLGADPRRAYAGLVDEQVLEFLLVSLLAFQTAWPERLAELEGSAALLERLQHQFPTERLAALRQAAQRLAGTLQSAAAPPRRSRRRASRREPRGGPQRS